MKQEQFQKALDIKDSIENEDILAHRLERLINIAEEDIGDDPRDKFSSLLNSDSHFVINQEPELAKEIYQAAKELILKHIKQHETIILELKAKFEEL